MSLRSRRGWIITPGGVALADILANSVAVILILILATLAYREQQTRDELERNTDLTTILARQLATSVVFNDLPSSPPSVLHDYDSCDIPHDCDHTLFPVLELFDGYLRIFNTNTYIYRAELLRQNNALDRYLATLPPAQSRGIRMDIHGVGEYYLVLGILEEHGIRPRHWHYLGEHVPPLADSPLQENIAGIRRPDEQPLAGGLSRQDSEGEDRRGGGGQQDTPDDGLPAALEGVSLGDAGVLGALNYDTLLPPAFDAERGGGAQNADPFAQRPPGRRGDGLLERQGQPGPIGRGGNRPMRLHIPNAAPRQGGRVLVVAPEDYALLVLSYLFKVLESARAERAFEPEQHNRWLIGLAQNPQAVSTLPHYDLVRELAESLRYRAASAHPLLQDIQLAPRLPYNRLLARPNVMEGDLALNLNQATPWLSALLEVANVRPRFLMRPHPSVYKGEALDLPRGYSVLMLPDEIERPGLAWRPLAVVDSQLQDIALGFVYSGIEQEQLTIHAGVNQLLLNGRPAANPRLHPRDRLRALTPALWIVAVFGLLLLLRFAPRRARA